MIRRRLLEAEAISSYPKVETGGYMAFGLPKSVRISRSILTSATPHLIFPYLNQPKLQMKWNPFLEGDSTLQCKFDGPEEGVGASFEWAGKRAGAGRATIVQSTPNQSVQLRLEFKKPFLATNFGEYRIDQEGSQSRITWTVDETATIPRILSLFVSLDRVVGGQFEKGLEKLKVLVGTAG